MEFVIAGILSAVFGQILFGTFPGWRVFAFGGVWVTLIAIAYAVSDYRTCRRLTGLPPRKTKRVPLEPGEEFRG